MSSRLSLKKLATEKELLSKKMKDKNQTDVLNEPN